MIGNIAGPRPPMRHRATVERLTSGGLSPTRQQLPGSRAVVIADMPCSYWEPTRAADAAGAGLREGPNVVIVALGPRMLVRKAEDIRVGDVVTEVREGTNVITSQQMRAEEVLWRSTHQEVGLELLSAGPLQEGVGS